MVQFYTIAVIAILAAMSPGPDFVVVVKNSLCRSRKEAIKCSFGVCAGILFHVSYCVLGLAFIIAKSILLFNVIKYLGAFYLMYIGIKNIKSKQLPVSITEAQDEVVTAKRSAFMEGLLVNILNPKCTLFMLSIFTVVLDVNSSMLLRAGYGVEIALIGLLWFILLSCGITLAPVQQALKNMQNAISKITGAILLALGLNIALK